MNLQRDEADRKANVLAFAFVALATMFAVIGQLGSGIDRDVRSMRYAISDKDPSGNIALVAMDEKSINEIGVYPWPRGTHGRLIEQLQGKGIERLGFDVAFVSDAPNPEDDARFSGAIAASEFPVGLAVPGDDTGGNTTGDGEGNVVKGVWPNNIFTDAGAETFSIWTDLNDDGQFEHAPHSNIVDGKPLIPMAKWLANLPVSEGRYLVDWDLDQRDIPTYSYTDILNGRIPAEELRGKILLVGADASRLGDFLPISTGEYVAGARAQIIAAETISSGHPAELDSMIVAVTTLLFAGICMTTLLNGSRYFVIAAIGGGLIVLQIFLESKGIAIIPIGDSMLVLVSAAIACVTLDVIRYFYSRMTRNEGTGLPNLLAMKRAPQEPCSTIVLNISNHLDILSELGSEGRDKVMTKVAQRIELGSRGKNVYQIDSSSFAWRGSGHSEDDIEQVEAIQALLRAGVSYANATIDIFANAGIDVDLEASIEQAVNNAGIAANRANSRGISWEIYKEDDTDEHWKISVVSEITTAIEKGHLWVAYQPKVDSKTSNVIGAEALVRWKHPTRGDIRPDAFIPLLEKANRTEDLTRFMFERAMEDFSKLDGCTVAVNVSPLMIGEGKLLKMVKASLQKTGFKPGRLTVEITESERFTNPRAVAELEDVRKLGVKISIDDYGMGNSTVNYLRILPADELKIDRSFISNVLANKSDRVVVASTINLAHEMGLKVVAEGVESADIQAYLNELHCDFIQGYHTGRPVGFDEFLEAAKMANGDNNKVA